MFVYTIAPLVTILSIVFSVLVAGAIMIMLKNKFSFKGIVIGIFMIILAIFIYYFGVKFIISLI